MASAVPDKHVKEAKVEVKLRRQSTATAEKNRKTSGDKRRSSMLVRWFKYLAEGSSDSRQKKHKSDDAVTSLPPRPASMVVPDSSSHLDTPSPAAPHTSQEKSESGMYSKSKSHSLDGLEKLDHVEVHSVVHTTLAQPADVVANSVVVSTGPPTQSPQDRLKLQESVITTALRDKRNAVAEILGIPAEDFTNISEMAAEVDGDKEPRELVLASLHQAEQLTCLVNVSLVPSSARTDRNVQSSAVTVRSGGDTLPHNADIRNNNDRSDVVDSSRTLSDCDVSFNGEAGTPDRDHSNNVHESSPIKVSNGSVDHSDKLSPKEVYVDIPSRELIAITTKLNAQLHHLMEVLAVREKEQERLQEDLKSAQAQITLLLHSEATRSPSNSFSHTSRPNSYISVTSSLSETGETSEDHDAMPENHDATPETQVAADFSPARYGSLSNSIVESHSVASVVTESHSVVSVSAVSIGISDSLNVSTRSGESVLGVCAESPEPSQTPAVTGSSSVNTRCDSESSEHSDPTQGAPPVSISVHDDSLSSAGSSDDEGDDKYVDANTDTTDANTDTTDANTDTDSVPQITILKDNQLDNVEEIDTDAMVKSSTDSCETGTESEELDTTESQTEDKSSSVEDKSSSVEDKSSSVEDQSS